MRLRMTAGMPADLRCTPCVARRPPLPDPEPDVGAAGSAATTAVVVVAAAAPVSAMA